MGKGTLDMQPNPVLAPKVTLTSETVIGNETKQSVIQEIASVVPPSQGRSIILLDTFF
ncbi:hypothetical protein [Sunxiuqinia rutila]|uniref:hypothetical protein n=1 Tax=Sunxiuqinia rutila TaxID=1397841 RepID=UPI003D3684E3